MSETKGVDFEDQRARVWRSLEETEEFVAQQKRLMAEDAIYDSPLTHWQIGQFAAGGAAAGAALVGVGIAFAKLFLP